MPLPPAFAGGAKVVRSWPSTTSGAVVGRLVKSIPIEGCRKFSRKVGSVRALMRMAEARRSRSRAATSAWNRPAWSRLAKEAREMATIIEIIAQTMTNSTNEKPVSGDLLTLCFGIEFDMVSTFRRGSKVKTALEQFPLRKCLFSLDFTLGLETGGGLAKNA